MVKLKNGELGVLARALQRNRTHRTYVFYISITYLLLSLRLSIQPSVHLDYKGLAHRSMEAEKSHYVQVTSWRPKASRGCRSSLSPKA